MWTESSKRIPDIVTISTGLHSCFHALPPQNVQTNQSMIDRHEADVEILMQEITKALDRANKFAAPKYNNRRTMVIFVTAGRIHNRPIEPHMDACVYKFNRVLAHGAHKYGFAVFEREEIERRLLYKSEHWEGRKTIVPNLHLPAPAPALVATSLLSLISCLKNGTLSSPLH